MFRLRIAKLSKGLVGVASRTAQKPSAVPHIRYFSSTVDKDGPKVTVPDNFYDEEVEAEKEFADIKASLNLGGLQKLTITKVTADVAKASAKANASAPTTKTTVLPESLDDAEIEKMVADIMAKYGVADDDAEVTPEVEAKMRADLAELEASLSQARIELDAADGASDDSDMEDIEAMSGDELEFSGSGSDDELNARAGDSSGSEDDEGAGSADSEDDEDSQSESEDDGADDSDEDSDVYGEESDEDDALMDAQLTNPTELWRKDEEYPDELLRNFIPDSSSTKNDAFSQGLRACPGKLQRRGIKPELRCHKIDLDAVNFVDVLRLKDFMSADGEIMPKKETGLCAKCQRKVAKTIKQARSFGMLPHIGEFTVKDAEPSKKQYGKYHNASPKGARRVDNKSVL